MKKIMMILVAAVVLALFVGAGSADTAVGGDRGIIQVHCNVDGASVVLVSINGDESSPQTITNGQTEFAVYTTATPYKEVKVSADGYETATVPVTMPAKGETSVVEVNLSPVMVGGDRGVIQVHCNVEGASVVLVSINGDESSPQTITNGQTEFTVYTTATPYKEVKVSADGYETATAAVTMPAKGETSVVEVELVPAQMVGGDRGVIQVRCDVNGATVELISVSNTVAYTGTIENGQAEFSVYTTATPITQARVSANGYETATVPVTMPAKGETSVVDVTLTPVPAPTQSPMGLALVGLHGAIGAVALLRRE